MTVLSAANSAAVRVIGSELAALFSSTDQIALEFRDLIQDVADDIAGSCDWRSLTKIATFTGDGERVTFPVPADMGRMVQGSYVDDPASWLWGYVAIPSVNEWMRRRSRAWLDPGGWILMGGEYHFWPAPNGDAEFPYISNNIVRADNGALKPAFTSDTDTFVLSERLLTLGLIWRYRAQKGIDYSEDLASYELELSMEMTRDKGARKIIRHGYGYPCYPFWC